MSFSIGPIHIADPVFLAPMTGVTDLPFRRIVKRYGAGLVFSEMIASRSMIEEWRTSRPKADYHEEAPMVVQLAGCDPEVMAEAARMKVDHGAAIIDINFGCPVKKIVNTLGGSALMKDEPLAAKILEETVKAVNVPVTVKMRLGWDETSLNAPTLAKIAEDVGIKMITIHGRTRKQMYSGQADWSAVQRVKEAVKLPIVVNGDIVTPEHAKEAMKLSGADGVMIGRGAFGRPWFLRQIIDYLNTGTSEDAPPIAELSAVVLEHYEAIISHYGIHPGVGIARKHLSWYCKDLPNWEETRNVVNVINDPATVTEKMRDYFSVLMSSRA